MSHVPVLLNQSISSLLKDKTSGIFVDATLGGGSSSKRILERIDCKGRVIGIDRDPSALNIASRRLQPYPNFTAVRDNFRVLDEILLKMKVEAVDGILADLGISSMQIDDPTRGFRIKSDSRLDMRMDLDITQDSAHDLLNNLDEKSLKELFREFGEGRWAGRIASRIVEQRMGGPIETTAELAKLVERAIPRRFHPRRIHPATRIFLALRVKVNDSLGALQELLDKAPRLLNTGGRLVILSYHSLEDRITKWTFRKYSKEPERLLKIITKKPITP